MVILPAPAPGPQAVHYPNAAVREVLERTLGVPIFQEQVIGHGGCGL